MHVDSPAPELTPEPGVQSRLVSDLYVEAMVLADDARSVFEHERALPGNIRPPAQRLAIACAATRATALLTETIAWLLDARFALAQSQTPALPVTERAGVATYLSALPDDVARVVEAVRRLTARVDTLRQRWVASSPVTSPAAALHDRLRRAIQSSAA